MVTHQQVPNNVPTIAKPNHGLPVKVSRHAKKQDTGVVNADGSVANPSSLSPSTILAPVKIHRNKKGGKDDIKYGPEQVPIEDQRGTYLDRSVLTDIFQKDALGRDAFTIEERIREWSETEELYHKHKYAPLPIDPKVTHMPEFGVHLVGGDMGQGKSLAPPTPLIMYDGTVKKAKDVVEGDLLMGPDSKPRTVLKTTHGYGPMCRITPTKGAPWECNDVHILTLVKTNSSPSRPAECKRNGEVIDIEIGEYLSWSKPKQYLYKQFSVGVNFPWQPPLPLEPYLLGILLGDGHLGRNTIQITNSDPEIIEYCRQVADRWGCELATNFEHEKKQNHYFRGEYGSDGITAALEELNICGHRSPTKFIPQQYKTASREDRLELLAGLVDTDGNLLDNLFDYISASKQLRDDIVFVAHSVGLAAHTSTKAVKYKGEWRDYYRVKICGEVDMVPTKVARKQAQPRQQKKNALRTAFKVEPIGDGDYCGWVLDGDGRFLLGDFTVTHNTLFCTWLARHWRRKGWNIFSTAGFLFGQRLDLRDAYGFPDHVTQGGLVFPDEVHTLVDRYSANSVRSRTFGQSSTAMRKERVTCLGASAHTIMVGWEYKGVSECVIIPRRWYPTGKLHAPPFCYVEIVKLFPFPYRRKDQLLMDAGLVKGVDQRRAIWRPPPQELMAAAKLMDSFEAVKIGENFGLDAKAMKTGREDDAHGGGSGGSGGRDQGPEQAKRNLIVVIRRVWDANYIAQGRPCSFSTIRDVINEAGKESGLRVTSVELKSALEIVGCPVNAQTVHEDDLRELFEELDKERDAGG